MLQDPNVERYVQEAMKPVLKQIKELQAEVELLKKALHKTDVSRRVNPYDLGSVAEEMRRQSKKRHGR